jgi:hypothetical protein
MPQPTDGCGYSVVECRGDKMKKSLVLFIFIFVVQNNFAAGRIETHSQSQALLFKQKRVDWKGAPESSVFYECCLFRVGDDVGLVDYFLKTGFLKDTVLFIRFDESGMAEIKVDNYLNSLKIISTRDNQNQKHLK